jgi:aryl-alcohol dehydrogenase-like predicted oxidoreductase
MAGVKKRYGNTGSGRLATVRGSGNPVFDKFTERNWRILDVLREVAAALGRTPAEVALRFIAMRPGVASTIVGATRLEQLEANLGALDLELPDELAARLEEASRPEPVFPYLFFTPAMRAGIDGGASVRREPAWFRPRE